MKVLEQFFKIKAIMEKVVILKTFQVTITKQGAKHQQFVNKLISNIKIILKKKTSLRNLESFNFYVIT